MCGFQMAGHLCDLLSEPTLALAPPVAVLLLTVRLRTAASRKGPWEDFLQRQNILFIDNRIITQRGIEFVKKSYVGVVINSHKIAIKICFEDS